MTAPPDPTVQGYHWLQRNGEFAVFEWEPVGGKHIGFWKTFDCLRSPKVMADVGWEYCVTCVTPAEIAAIELLCDALTEKVASMAELVADMFDRGGEAALSERIRAIVSEKIGR